MNLRWSATAISDLKAIRAYIAQDRPLAAKTVAAQIMSATHRLESFPLSGREGRVVGTREPAIAGHPIQQPAPYPKNPRFCWLKFPKFGNIVARLPCDTPNQLASVAAYCVTDVVGIHRPSFPLSSGPPNSSVGNVP